MTYLVMASFQFSKTYVLNEQTRLSSVWTLLKNGSKGLLHTVCFHYKV